MPIPADPKNLTEAEIIHHIEAMTSFSELKNLVKWIQQTQVTKSLPWQRLLTNTSTHGIDGNLDDVMSFLKEEFKNQMYLLDVRMKATEVKWKEDAWLNAQKVLNEHFKNGKADKTQYPRVLGVLLNKMCDFKVHQERYMPDLVMPSGNGLEKRNLKRQAMDIPANAPPAKRNSVTLTGLGTFAKSDMQTVKMKLDKIRSTLDAFDNIPADKQKECLAVLAKVLLNVTAVIKQKPVELQAYIATVERARADILQYATKFSSQVTSRAKVYGENQASGKNARDPEMAPAKPSPFRYRPKH